MSYNFYHIMDAPNLIKETAGPTTASVLLDCILSGQKFDDYKQTHYDQKTYQQLFEKLLDGQNKAYTQLVGRMFSELVQRFDWNKDEVQEILAKVSEDKAKAFWQLWKKRGCYDASDIKLAEELISEMCVSLVDDDTVWLSHWKASDLWSVVSTVRHVRLHAAS